MNNLSYQQLITIILFGLEDHALPRKATGCHVGSHTNHV